MQFSNHKEVLDFNNLGEGVGENGEKLMNPGKLFLVYFYIAQQNTLQNIVIMQF